MPVLPLIDLLILLAWTCLIVGSVEKALGMAMARRMYLVGMSPFDWVTTGGVCLIFALALAARVWVRANEAGLLRARRNGRSAEVLPDFPDPREPVAAAPARPRDAESPPARLALR
jgi:hypothetical protein